MRRIAFALLVVAQAGLVGSVLGQGSAITYQGELRSGGVPAVGAFDLRFRLFDAASGGNQVGITLCADNVSVVDGRFVVTLDFGSVYTDARFLAIEVRVDAGQACDNAAGFTPLAGRQPLTPAPAATYAPVAGDATLFGGQSPVFYRNAANLTGTIDDARISSNIPRLNFTSTFTAIPAFNGGTTGSSAPFSVDSTFKVTNLNADLLDGLDSGSFALTTHTHDAGAIVSGTLADARIPTTVGRLGGNQNWTGSNVFSGSNSFSGDGSGLTSLNASQLVSGQVPDSRLPATVARLASANTFTAAQSINPGATQTPLSLVGSNNQGTWLTINNSLARSWNIIASSTNNAEGSGKLVFRDATANAVRMTLDTAGSVGIGTSNPAGRLDVTGADPRVAIRNANDPGGGYVLNSFGTVQLGLYNPTASAWNAVPANGQRAMFGVDSTGRVGSLTNTGNAPSFRNILDDGSGNASIQGNLAARNMPAVAFAASTNGTSVLNNASETLLESITINVPGDGFIRIFCNWNVLVYTASPMVSQAFLELKETTGAEVLTKEAIFRISPDLTAPSTSVEQNVPLEHIMPVTAGTRRFKVRLRHDGGGGAYSLEGGQISIMYFPRGM